MVAIAKAIRFGFSPVISWCRTLFVNIMSTIKTRHQNTEFERQKLSEKVSSKLSSSLQMQRETIERHIGLHFRGRLWVNRLHSQRFLFLVSGILEKSFQHLKTRKSCENPLREILTTIRWVKVESIADLPILILIFGIKNCRKHSSQN